MGQFFSQTPKGATTIWAEVFLIPTVVEGYFYGLYSAIFALYYHMQCQTSIDKTKNILFHLLCGLYALSTITFVIDIVTLVCDESFFVVYTDGGVTVIRSAINNLSAAIEPTRLRVTMRDLYWLSIITNGLCDFISQAILIYRCWIVWGGKTRMIIIPSILAFIFLVTWLLNFNTSAPRGINHENLLALNYLGGYAGLGANETYLITLTSLALSLTVNAIVTALIAFKLVKVYLEAKPTSQGGNLNSRVVVSDGGKLRSVIFIIMESGAALFAIQLFRMRITAIQAFDFRFIIGIHQMLNGITPTIILVRVSMRLSYYDERSMMETVSSLRFISHNDSEDSLSDDVIITSRESS